MSWSPFLIIDVYNSNWRFHLGQLAYIGTFYLTPSSPQHCCLGSCKAALHNLVWSGHVKTRAAHSDQIYIHSRCAVSDVRTRGFLPKIRGKKKVCATAASTCKVFVWHFGWKFVTDFLLFWVALENLFLFLRTLEGSFWQEPQNELGVNEKQGRKTVLVDNQFRTAMCASWRKMEKNHCLKSLS